MPLGIDCMIARGVAKAAELEAVAQKGDKSVSVHIPRGQPLDTDECLSSIENAKKFFEKYFPGFEYKCFTCYS